MSINTCFNQVIGFSRSEDICVNGWDASYAVSRSGLFIDEFPGMSLRILNAVGGKDDLWQLMDRARTTAINIFKTDIWGELLKFNEYRRLKFSGEIGYRRFTDNLVLDTYHGMRLYSNIRGGTFTLRGVTLNLNATETVDLLVYDDYGLLYTVSIDSLAGKPNYNVITPIELDLNGNYYFLYSPVSQPKNNKMTCGCGGYRWCFDLDNPCFKASKENWTLWCMAGGVHGDDPADREDWGVSQYAQGLRLHGDFKCDSSEILCSDASDFENNEVDQAIAWAIGYKTSEFATYEISKSLEVSRDKLIGDDQTVAVDMSYYSDRYTAMINFIAENISTDGNDCLHCKPVLGMGKISQSI